MSSPSNALPRGSDFVVNGEGKGVAVLIDLDRHGKLGADFYDALLARHRAKEPRCSLQTVRSSLKKSGKLSG